MLIVNALAATGVLYAGLSTWQKRRNSRKMIWLAEAPEPEAEAQNEASEARLAQIEKTVNRNFTLSSLSVGLAMSGALIYWPLGLISVPFTVITATPTFAAAYEAVFYEGRQKISIVGSFAIVGLLATNYFFTAAFLNWTSHYLNYLVFWGRRVNQTLTIEMADSYRQFLFRLFGGPPESVWVLADQTEVEIPFAQLNIGDVIIINEGEIIPIEGLVVEGKATIDLFILTGDVRRVEISKGDHVTPLTVVRAGRLNVRVEKIEARRS